MPAAPALQKVLDRSTTDAHLRFAREHLLSAAHAEREVDAVEADDVDEYLAREVLVEEIRDYRLTIAVMHLLQAFARG